MAKTPKPRPLTPKPEKLLVAVYVCWKRRKGKPMELRGVTCGGPLAAMCLAKEIADHLEIPQSWIEMKFYKLVNTELK